MLRAGRALTAAMWGEIECCTRRGSRVVVGVEGFMMTTGDLCTGVFKSILIGIKVLILCSPKINLRPFQASLLLAFKVWIFRTRIIRIKYRNFRPLQASLL